MGASGDFTPTGPEPAALRDDVQHPERPVVQPGTEVYSRQIDATGEEFTLRSLSTSELDIDLMHVWLNNPRVDKWFGEGGSRDKHERFVQQQVDDPHSLAVIGSFDGAPATFFEVYWCLEDRLSRYYDAQPYDRGLHLFVGSERHRGPERVKAWMTSVLDFCFKDEPRTERVYIEPHFRNDKIIGYLEGAGFVSHGTFDYPHRRAALLSMSRESFFSAHPLLQCHLFAGQYAPSLAGSAP